MSRLLCLCALSMVAVLTHTPYVAIAYGEVILTTDAQPIALPDTYVVPVGANVTFTCSSSSGRDKLLWSLNVTGSKGYSRIISNTEGLNDQPGVRVSDESTSNTSIITLHNISLESNPSPVECNDLNIQDGSKVLMLIVEGSPNCPTVHTTVSTTLLTVSIQKSQMMWLLEWYCVKAVSDSVSIARIVSNSTLKGFASFEVTPREPDTVYNISVTPCNMAGCNKSCDVHSVQTERKGPDVHSEPDNAALAIALTVMLAAIMVLIAMTTTIIICCHQRRERPTKSGGGEEPRAGNDLVTKHCSLKGFNRFSVDPTEVSLQLHNQDPKEAVAPYEEPGGGVTNSDIVHQPTEAAVVKSTTMEISETN